MYRKSHIARLIGKRLARQVPRYTLIGEYLRSLSIRSTDAEQQCYEAYSF
jgi:hypothetical protein